MIKHLDIAAESFLFIWSSSYDEPELGGLSWHYSTTSVDSAFVSHTDENDNLTSQLIPTSQRA